MKFKKMISLILSVIFVSTSAFGSNKSATYVAFESYYKQITNADRTLNFKKLEQIFRRDPEVHQNFLVLLRMLRKTQSPRIQLLFFEKEGERFPRIQIDDGKQGLFIDIHGEQDRFMRIGNAYYSVEELRTPVLFLKKYFASNPKEDQRLKEALLTQPLEITFEMWSFLSPEQRALTLAGLRALLYDAIRVKEAFGRGREVSRNHWFEQLLVPRALAAEGKDCVVAGYKAQNKNGRCETSTVQGAAEGCGSRQFPCNPVVFGYDSESGNKPYCLNMSDESFQTATRVCHERAPLSGPQDVRKFLDSLLKSKNKNTDDFLGTDGQVKPGKFQELRQLVIDPFNSQIDSAIQACRQPEQFDPQQFSACQALEERRGQFKTYLDSVGGSEGSGMCPPVQPPTSPGGRPTTPPSNPGTPEAPQQGAVTRPGCVPNVPGGVSPAPSSPGQPGAGSQKPPTEPGFFGSIWRGISSSASGVWKWMTGPGQGITLALALTGGVGYLVYSLVNTKPKGSLSPRPQADPVVPPISVPVIPPTTPIPPVTPAIR